jgi:hypothetical protein
VHPGLRHIYIYISIYAEEASHIYIYIFSFVFPFVWPRFDYGAMTAGIESCKQEVDAACLRIVQQVQTDREEFVIKLTAFLVLATVVGKEARWMESCPCHEHIWMAHSNFVTKQKRLLRTTGYALCPWKGKRACEMALGRPEIFLRALNDADSPRLKELLARTCSPTTRTSALSLIQRLKSRLVESLAAKLAFWKHIPWTFCGLWRHGWKLDAASDRGLVGTAEGII